MKKVLFLFILTFMVSPMVAQESKEGVALDKLLLEVGTNAGLKNKGYTPLTMSAHVGYHFFSRLYAFVKTEGMLNLYDKHGVKTYLRSQDLGGGLGIQLTNPKTCHDGIDFRLSLTNSIGNADWKHTVYDANVIWYSHNRKKYGNLYLGVGIKHINSHTAGISNYNGAYVSVGIKF